MTAPVTTPVEDRTDDGDLIRPETDSDVAEKLGVSRQLVTRVVNRANGGIIDHERMRARRYKENNPDASFREIARNVDAAKATVTRWIKEDFDEGDDEDDDDDQPTLTATTTAGRCDLIHLRVGIKCQIALTFLEI